MTPSSASTLYASPPALYLKPARQRSPSSSSDHSSSDADADADGDDDDVKHSNGASGNRPRRRRLDTTSLTLSPTSLGEASPQSPRKKQKRNKPTLSCRECVERKTKVSGHLLPLPPKPDFPPCCIRQWRTTVPQ